MRIFINITETGEMAIFFSQVDNITLRNLLALIILQTKLIFYSTFLNDKDTSFSAKTRSQSFIPHYQKLNTYWSPLFVYMFCVSISVISTIHDEKTQILHTLQQNAQVSLP